MNTFILQDTQIMKKLKNYQEILIKLFSWELGKDLFGKYSLDPKILAGKSIIKGYPTFTPES